MNIEKLIVAAREIDALAQKQEERGKAWLQLAHDARQSGANRADITQRRQALSGTVVEFGTAIEDLRAALRAKS